ncbi:hypothetical protein EDC04DRAFT_2887044 [Pisolithus marmoratus]|nr:hypothetical protein EDC04DRAFT_2887044 [Pisolithus marmoratus]
MTGDKWHPAGADWDQGYHCPKSPRTVTNSTTPQMAQTPPSSEGAAMTSQEAAALQASLLGVLNHMMYGDSQACDNAASTADTVFSSARTSFSGEWMPVSQIPLLSSDNQQLTPQASSLPLSEISIQALLNTYSRNPLSASQSDIEEHKYFSTCIRLHALHLLKITDYKYLNTIKCALTSDEVEAYEQDIPGCPEVMPTNFIVDCAHGKAMPYNHEAFMVFAEDFLDKVNNHGWYTSQTIPEWYCNFDIIYGAFKAHFTYIKSCYNEVIIAASKDPVKAKEDVKVRLHKSSHTSRKVQLLKMHLDAMAEHPKLQKHLPLVNYLRTQGISSDESEDETRRMISYPYLAILEFLSIMIGKHKKAGTQLWNCPHSEKFNDAAAAPPGLPMNCYDATWLSSLHPHSKKQLRVQEEYDFAPGCAGRYTGSSVPLGAAGN